VEDIRVLAFFYIEQAALMSFIGMGLIGIRLPWKKIMFIGILQGMVVYLCRGILYSIYGLPFGTHTLVSFVSLIILFYLISKQSLGISLTATAIAFIIEMLSEGIIAPVLYNYISPLSLQTLDDNFWIHIGLSYLSAWLPLLTAAYLALAKKPLINIEAKKQKV
jgi:hypothetical protein